MTIPRDGWLMTTNSQSHKGNKTMCKFRVYVSQHVLQTRMTSVHYVVGTCTMLSNPTDTQESVTADLAQTQQGV